MSIYYVLIVTNLERNCKMICVDSHDIQIVEFMVPDMMSTTTFMAYNAESIGK